MKNVNDLIGDMNGKSLSEMSGDIPDKVDDAVVYEMNLQLDSMFKALKAYYTQHRVALGSPDLESSIREQWAYELVKSGVNEDMLSAGMSRAKTHSREDKWTRWPSISDFIAWCYDLPTPEQAYKEACDNSRNLGEWVPTHPAVGLAGREVTWFTLNNVEQSKSEPRYRTAYTALCERVVAGEVLEYSPRVMIEHIPLTAEEKKKELSDNFNTGRANIGGLKSLIGKPDKPEKPKEATKGEGPKVIAHDAEQERQRKLAALALAKSRLGGGGL